MLKRFCRKQGCKEIVSTGYCEAHKQDKYQYDKYRGTAHDRLYDARWRKARLNFLREHPLCVQCEEEGILKAANVVDHRIPHKGDQALFWETDNWQSLCARHHNIKTATVDSNFARKRK